MLINSVRAQGLLIHRFLLTHAAFDLQRRGLLENPARNVRILNARGVESASCSCYKVVALEATL